MDIVYWAILSIIAAVTTIYDKYAAGHNRRRIAEKTLFLLAFLGGGAAMYVSMLLVRHKTKHKRFMLGLPLLMVLQVAAYFFFLA